MERRPRPDEFPGFQFSALPRHHVRHSWTAPVCRATGAARVTRREALRRALAAAAGASIARAALPPAGAALPVAAAETAGARVADGAAGTADGGLGATDSESSAEARIDPGEREPEITDRVYLDLRAGDAAAQRVVLGLYGTVAPVTVANFVALVRARYAGTRVYRIVPSLTVQMGDVLGNGGARGESAAADGRPLPAENYAVSHTVPGIVSMARDKNGDVDSRFFITTRDGDSLYLDGRYVAFGRVLAGFENLKALERFVTTANVPKVPVVIESCGVLPKDT